MKIPSLAGHPRGLTICFFTELWERFSYYGMRALLIYYLIRHFAYTDNEAFSIYGAYTALVYLTPVVGGMLADRYLGARKAVAFGALLLVFGHFGLAFEGDDMVAPAVGAAHRDTTYMAIFYVSLSLIAVGVGFLKSNISTIVGKLYAVADPRREAGVTYFYMGANLGGAIAPVLCGWLAESYGWRYGFGLAGVGMLFGLAVFLRGQPHLANCAEPPDPSRLRQPMLVGLKLETWVYFAAVPLVAAACFALLHPWIVGYALALVGLSSAVFLLWFASRHCTVLERRHLLICAVLIAFTIGFWTFYEQMGSSLNLFANRVVNRMVGGRQIPASTLQSLPPIFVIAAAPLFAILWPRLARRGHDPKTAVKFAIGIAALALGFFALSCGASMAHGNEKVPLIWLAINFVLMVVGEMCLAPVGIAMVTRLSPPNIVGVMMGLFFLAYSASSFIAGQIAQLTSIPAAAMASAPGDLAQHYAVAFGRFSLAALGVALVLLMLSPWLSTNFDKG